MIKISKGLDLPISGTPIYEVEEQLVRSIGILGSDYPNLEPKMHVNIGDTVRAGDTLFEDKKNAGVAICTPVSGEITDIEVKYVKTFEYQMMKYSKYFGFLTKD